MQASSTNVATLIAVDRVDDGSVSEATDRLRGAGLEPGAPQSIDQGRAVDIGFTGDIPVARAALAPLAATLDLAVQPVTHRRKMLLVSDMDSTIITVECIDELADYAGIKPQIAAITERAMQGELDFEAALRARVALLKGLHHDVIGLCIAERVRLMPGAAALVATMRGWGARTILVSGGFTDFVDAVGKMAGFDHTHANRLGMTDDRLSGTVEGDIVDAHEKARQLDQAQRDYGVDPRAVLSVGDGANDIMMIEAAIDGGGIGTAYHAKPALADRANFTIRHGDLTALLFAQGVPRSEWHAAE